MTVAADILAACAQPCAKADIIRATGLPSDDVDAMLERLVQGCYLIIAFGKYRLTTVEERLEWFALPEPRAP